MGAGQSRWDRLQTQSLRETYRGQLLASIGGWRGTILTAIPPVVFVVVNALSSLRPAIAAAVGCGVALTGYRLARRQSIQQAVSGLFAVLVAAFIAARTGEARGYFLFGIWTSFAYAVPFGVSILVRRPLIGVVWEFLDPTPVPGADPAADPAADPTPDPAAGPQSVASQSLPWYRRAPLLRAYTLATAAATTVFLARGLVQWSLYGHRATGWLAFARVSMGFPLYIAALGFAFWVVSRARRRLTTAAVPHPGDAQPSLPVAKPDGLNGLDKPNGLNKLDGSAIAQHGGPDR